MTNKEDEKGATGVLTGLEHVRRQICALTAGFVRRVDDVVPRDSRIIDCRKIE
jgi:hypothetical protein